MPSVPVIGFDVDFLEYVECLFGCPSRTMFFQSWWASASSLLAILWGSFKKRAPHASKAWNMGPLPAHSKGLLYEWHCLSFE